MSVMPTSCDWITQEQASFAVSYTDPHVSIFDATTGIEKVAMNFSIEDNKPFYA
jgi:hypothetical protein